MFTSDASTSPLDVLVIGAGQAGLVTGYQLMRSGLRFLIVERHERVGDSWRERFDSLLLFTPRAFSALPGLEVPGDPEGYPTKDEIASYLESYARKFALPVELSTGVERLKLHDGRFQASTSQGRAIDSRAVILATGAFQIPAIPALSKEFAEEVMQLTPDTYRNPRQIPPGTVLVVGDGATGRQIAKELAASRRVLLSTGKARRASPERILGKSTFWWMDKLGLLRLSRETRIGKYMMRTDPFPGKDLTLTNLQKIGIEPVARLTAVHGDQVAFASGQSDTVNAVIWATGYRDDSRWVTIPGVAEDSGAFVHERGVTPVANLYHIGRSWQWTRGSALLFGVGDDAARVVQLLVRDLDSAAPEPMSSGSGLLTMIPS